MKLRTKLILISLGFTMLTTVLIGSILNSVVQDTYRNVEMDLFEQKMIGLDNLMNSTIKRIALNYLMIRGLNEFALKELIDLGVQDNNISYLKIRSLGKVGRFVDTKPYTVLEFKQLIH